MTKLLLLALVLALALAQSTKGRRRRLRFQAQSPRSTRGRHGGTVAGDRPLDPAVANRETSVLVLAAVAAAVPLAVDTGYQPLALDVDEGRAATRVEVMVEVMTIVMAIIVEVGNHKLLLADK